MPDPHPLSDLPTSLRIDCTLAVLSCMEMQEGEGWSLAELADLCGCSQAAIHARQQAALEKIKARTGPSLSQLITSINP